MKIHPRQAIVAAAQRELGDWLIGWRARHDLTLVEELICYQASTASALRSMLQQERHPDDPEKKAGEASEPSEKSVA